MSRRILTNKFYLLLLIPLIISQSSASNSAHISNRQISFVLNINTAFYTDLGGDKLYNDIIVNFTTLVNYNSHFNYLNIREHRRSDDNVISKSCNSYQRESDDDSNNVFSYSNILTINKVQNSKYLTKSNCLLNYHLKLTLTLPSGNMYQFKLRLFDVIGSNNNYLIKLNNLATESGWYNIKLDVRFKLGGYTNGSANFDFDPPGMSQGHDPIR